MPRGSLVFCLFTSHSFMSEKSSGFQGKGVQTCSLIPQNNKKHSASLEDLDKDKLKIHFFQEHCTTVPRAMKRCKELKLCVSTPQTSIEMLCVW